MSDKNEPISVKAFKSMIEGMDMVSGEDWTPTDEQWQRIRAKIEQLEETVEQVRVVAPRPDVPGSRLQPERTAAPVVGDAPVVNPDNPWENGTGSMPDVQGSVPGGEVVMGESMSALTPNPAAKTRQVPHQPEPGVVYPVAPLKYAELLPAAQAPIPLVAIPDC